MTRALRSVVARLLKQPLTVINKAGPAGAVGMQSAAVAKPRQDQRGLSGHAARVCAAAGVPVRIF